ncbi:MAG: alanine racemase [Spirochaetota bacterium]
MLYQTHAIVHLGNIRCNIEGIRRAIGPGRGLLVAVKANGYGHGAVEVARTALRAGADWLGVATVPEGIELREAGIELPILKFSPLFEEELEAALLHRLTLCVCDEAGARSMQSAAAALAGTVWTGPARVHLKVDTGMGRVGVSPGLAPALASLIERECPALFLEGIFTHLPVSDQADRLYTQEQLARFKAVVESVNEAIGRKLGFVHAANSGAVLGHEEAWLDLVRPGIMAYGHYPDEGTPRSIPLLPGMSLKTRISFIKRVAAGTAIGYGRSWTSQRDTLIATMPAGYADGFNRLFSNRGRVLVDGRSCPVVGRVCMDQSMIDLGPGSKARVGDEVTLMGRSGGEEINCEEWARVLGSITYEVTCQINARVPRLYEGGD